MEIDESIFRAYDIRGIYPRQINEDIANKIGKAFGNIIGAGKEVIVGRDLRSSGENLKKGLIEGLNFSGVNVIDIGTVPTPIVYFAICNEKKDGGIVVTGSHLSSKWNGIKLCRENGLPLTYESGIEKIKDSIINERFSESVKKGKIIKRDFIEKYVQYLLSKVKINRKLKIIVDIGNGTCGEVAKKIFKNLKCKVKFLFPEPDENFPNHIPDPLKEETLKYLKEEVIKNKADIGIAYDGDGDRIGIIDEKGNIIRNDILLILIAKNALEKKKNLRFLFEVRCSRLTFELIKNSGGIPEFVRVGHSYIMQEARKKKAIAGELSGHFYFPEYYYDDGFFASLKIIEILSNSNKKLSEMIDFKKYCSSPEIRIDYPDDKKFDLVNRIKKIFIDKKYEVIAIDGARVEFKNGWGLVRASNTEPKVVLRFEGKDKKSLEEIKNKIMDVVKEEALKDGIKI